MLRSPAGRIFLTLLLLSGAVSGPPAHAAAGALTDAFGDADPRVRDAAAAALRRVRAAAD